MKGGASPLAVWTEACEGPRSRRSAAKHSKQVQVTAELDGGRLRDDVHWLMMTMMMMMNHSEKSGTKPEDLVFRFSKSFLSSPGCKTILSCSSSFLADWPLSN